MLKIHACKNLLNYYMQLELHAFDQREITFSITCSFRVPIFFTNNVPESDKSFAQLKQKEGKNFRGSEPVFPSLRNEASIVFLG